MKKLIILLLLLLSTITTLTAFGQTEYQLNLERAKQSDEAQPKQYMKYKDGTVIFVGKWFYQYYGVITNDDTFNNFTHFPYGIKIADITDDGCRVYPMKQTSDGDTEPDYDNDCFIEGYSGLSDRTYYFIEFLKCDGVFTYSTTGGSSRTIPKYEIGVEVTKDDYLNYLISIGKVIPPTTNNIASTITAVNNNTNKPTVKP